MNYTPCFLLVLTFFWSCTFSGENGNASVDAETHQLAHEGEHDSSALIRETTAEQSFPISDREHYHVVEIKQMKFVPAELTVAKGDTVVWVNKGITMHDVTEQPAREWTSSQIDVGESWQMVVTKPADYYCSIHVVMKGKVLLSN